MKFFTKSEPTEKKVRTVKTVKKVTNVNIDAKPLFIKGDIVKLKPEFEDFNANQVAIAGKEFKVVVCYYSDLMDMNPCIIYLEGYGAINPYLAEHFKKVEL